MNACQDINIDIFNKHVEEAILILFKSFFVYTSFPRFLKEISELLNLIRGLLRVALLLVKYILKGNLCTL